jgi:two-component system, NtrC family, nitrogen regulation sensor histidine kinase NtrY
MAFDAQTPITLGTQRKRVPLGRSPRRLSFEKRIRLWLYLMGGPLLLLCASICHQLATTLPVLLIWSLAAVFGWMLAVSFLLEQIVRPLQTLANVVAALREDDYSFRARGARRNDAMGDLALEINTLAGMLQTQRASAIEATALVERVIESMQSPVLAFDPDGCLRLLNPAGEKIFSLTTAFALGRSSSELKLNYLLTSADGELLSVGQQTERWVVKRTYFRLQGVRHSLLMLSNVSAVLREEERMAWERLIRVLGHEINNSLTPIKSIAGSLRGRLPESASGRDFDRGLAVIEDRAESLNRFLQAYQKLMGLPIPKLKPVSLASVLERVVDLETRLHVSLFPSDDVMVRMDADQIQQALINLVRNATEAALSADASAHDAACVQITWHEDSNEVVISIRDNGPGLSNLSNLFVPFYTTKPGGTGVGLVLTQQIAEAHRGTVKLRNLEEGKGCIAELHLPSGIPTFE